MRVKITRNTVADRRPVRVGEVHDLSDADARVLIQLGKAESFVAVEPPSMPMDTEQTSAVIDTPRKRMRRGNQ
jgi:hypothetical protein